MLAPSGAEVVVYPGLGELPHFNPDLDTDTPPEMVRELRREIALADGLLICSPEYAHGIAGSMKNALDWLVSSAEFAEKPVALINASQRAVHAQAQLREILHTMSARLVDDASITLPLLGRNLDPAGIVSDLALSAQLQTALKCFSDKIRTCTPPSRA
jgi:chromate reductase